MSEIEIHQRENNEISETHLKDNGEKFNRHCVEVLRLLYQGKKLTGRQLETIYGYDSRRLRDIYANRKDIVREWVIGEDGKTKFMQYHMVVPKQPTKAQVISMYQQTELNLQ